MNETTISNKISDSLNCMGIDYKRIGLNLAHDHPTLQQNFMRLIVNFIEAESRNEYVDPRNEGTVELCKKFQAVIDQEGAYLPHI